MILKITCRNRKYTSRPRMSGTPGGYELVQILQEAWRSSGIDEVRVTPYDVLMSYPNRTNPNRVCIWKPALHFFQRGSLKLNRNSTYKVHFHKHSINCRCFRFNFWRHQDSWFSSLLYLSLLWTVSVITLKSFHRSMPTLRQESAR